YTRVALLEDNCGSVCLSNQGTVQNLAKQDGFQLVSTQIDPVGATDVTPQVLAMLSAKPQIILFGLVPGTDSIAGMQAAAVGKGNAIGKSQEGWRAGLAVTWAITQAGSLDAPKVMQTLHNL